MARMIALWTPRPAPTSHGKKAARKTARAKPKTLATALANASTATVVVMGDLPTHFAHTTTAPPVKKSKFREKKEQKRKVKIQDVEDDDPEERLEKFDSHVTKVLSEIVETLGYSDLFSSTGNFSVGKW